MTYSIGPMPFINVSKPDNSSAAFLQVQPDNESCSFREVLRDTVKVRNKNETKADAAKNTIKVPADMRKTEVKVSNSKVSDTAGDIVGEIDEVQKLEKVEIIEELLQEKLEEFAEISNGEAITGEILVLLESIKVILKELIDTQAEDIEKEVESISAKVSELELMLEESQNTPELTKKLKTLISQIQDEIKMNAAENTEAKQVDLPSKFEISDAAKDIPKTENKISTEPNEKLKTAVTEKTSDYSSEQTSKSNRTETEVKEDKVKEAIDDKIDKFTVEETSEKGQQEVKADNQKTEKNTHKAIDIPDNKPDLEGTYLSQEQNNINKAEEIQNHASVQKVQPLDRFEIVTQIVKKAEAILTGGQTEMRIQLEPENLGKLTLKIAVERGLITAKFTAESYEVKQTIESNFNELKDMLQEKGLEIQNLSVSVGNNSKEFDYRDNSELWSDKLKIGSKNIRQATYNGYLEGFGTEVKVNPYSIHAGEFDQRA